MKYERLTSGVLLSDVIKEYDLCDDELRKRMFDGFNVIEFIDRFVELENKIEKGELISTVQNAQSEQEIEFFAKHDAEVRKQAVRGFVEEFKSRYFFMMTTYMKNPIYQCTGDELDRLVKEVCGE